MGAPTDIVMLTHNRLDHLVATVDALEARTSAPYRLTVVDNASEPGVRNWLAANRHRFHQLILLPTNEFLPAFQRGIDATTSDPFVLTDSDLVVPDLEPCWLTQLRDAMDRHPDFGALAVGLDQANLPPVQEPERIAPEEVVDGEIVERYVGTTYTMFRRDALRVRWLDAHAGCQSVTRAGYRCGWMLGVRAVHLGWDDFKLYPGHLASKLWFGEYREAQLIERPPTLEELAVAGPVVARTRAAGIPDASVLELTWSAPAIAASVPAAVAVERPQPDALPFGDGAAGAVVLVDPPGRGGAELVREACRVSTGLVVAIAPLDAFGARTASELAPPGWSGREAPGTGDVPAALAAAAGRERSLEGQLGVRTIEHREAWLALFAASAFGSGARRLWIWEREEPGRPPEAVQLDAARVTPWTAVAAAPRAAHRTIRQRADYRGRAIVRGLRERMLMLRAQRSRS